MTQEQLAHFKQRLLEEKNRIEGDRASYVSTVQSDTESQAPDEITDYDPNDPGDEGTDLYDRERSAAAIDNMGRILRKIERALQKIDEGTYGLSEIDNIPIPMERLEALPYALTTVDQDDVI